MEEEDMMALENEVDILMRADHPNIVKLFEIYEDDKSFYMVLELMTGGELFDRIIAKDKYNEQEAASTMLQILDGLQYCHKFGIVHRDLKPENLLYATPEEDSLIKISDFGLARFVPNSEIMNTMCGTKGYVAPEMLGSGGDVGYTKAIDYWSLGVILYIMLCGFPPFYDENEEALDELVRECKFDFPSPYWDNISDSGLLSHSAKDIIKNLLTKDPKARYNCEKLKSHAWFKESNSHNKLHISSAKEKFKKIGSMVKAASRFAKAIKK